MCSLCCPSAAFLPDLRAIGVDVDKLKQMLLAINDSQMKERKLLAMRETGESKVLKYDPRAMYVTSCSCCVERLDSKYLRGCLPLSAKYALGPLGPQLYSNP